MNREVFFTACRARLFGGALNPMQVEGCNVILDEWQRRGLTDDRWLAYMLATTKHETAHTMQPIKERGGPAYYKRMYDPFGERPALARRNGNVKAGDGARFCGRGYVQLTWANNYRAMGELLGEPLFDDPDLAMRPDIACKIMFEGMIRGTFTGKKLADYFSDAANDPRNARRIINGTDRAEEIAVLHKEFLKAIRSAQAAPVQPPPDVPVAEPKPKPSILQSVLAALAAAFKRG